MLVDNSIAEYTRLYIPHNDSNSLSVAFSKESLPRLERPNRYTNLHVIVVNIMITFHRLEHDYNGKKDMNHGFILEDRYLGRDWNRLWHAVLQFHRRLGDIAW
jgi:hypothetical protein